MHKAHVARMQVEATELQVKMNALESFIGGTTFGGLSMVKQGLLKAQLKAMAAYLEILQLRVELETED